MHADARRRFLEDPTGFASDHDLGDAERVALVALEEEPLRELGVHPLLTFLARLQVDLERKALRAEPG
jgi:hypothetical protein